MSTMYMLTFASETLHFPLPRDADQVPEASERVEKHGTCRSAIHPQVCTQVCLSPFTPSLCVLLTYLQSAQLYTRPLQGLSTQCGTESTTVTQRGEATSTNSPHCDPGRGVSPPVLDARRLHSADTDRHADRLIAGGLTNVDNTQTPPSHT